MRLEQRKTPHVVTLESALAKWDMLVTSVTLVIRDISNNQMEFAKVTIIILEAFYVPFISRL